MGRGWFLRIIKKSTYFHQNQLFLSNPAFTGQQWSKIYVLAIINIKNAKALILACIKLSLKINV